MNLKGEFKRVILGGLGTVIKISVLLIVSIHVKESLTTNLYGYIVNNVKRISSNFFNNIGNLFENKLIEANVINSLGMSL